MIVLHHLGISQSERILWLCEELGVSYDIVKHVRDPVLAPDSLKAVSGNSTGKSPFIEDTDAGITLSESGAICEYIMAKYGQGEGNPQLALPPTHAHYTDYLHWFHFANGTLQMNMVCSMFVDIAAPPPSNPARQNADERLTLSLKLLDERVQDNKWLAGSDFTAADIMTVYCVTTQRYFGPLVSLEPYPNLLRYLADCAARPAYQRAMRRGDPEMKQLIGAQPPAKMMGETKGAADDHWKKDQETRN